MVRIFPTALLLALAGCRSTQPIAPAEVLRWPPPPEPARVAFVQAVGAPCDLGVAPGVWQKALNVLTGGNRGAEPWSGPFGVWLGTDGDLCFTDTALAEVVCLEGAPRILWRWNQVGTNRLVAPVSVACVSGLVYVADSGLGRVLMATRRGQPRGELAFPFQRPVGVAAGPNRICVVDSEACCVQLFSLSGTWLQTIGRGGSGPGEFNRPTHVALDQRGWIYVSDSLNSRVQVFDAAGRFVRTVGCPGDSSGHFGRPKGVAVDGAGHLIVVDGLFGVVQVFDQQGHLLLDFGEHGQAAGQFWLPAGVAVNADGLLAVADTYNHRLQLFRLLPDGQAAGHMPAVAGGGSP